MNRLTPVQKLDVVLNSIKEDTLIIQYPENDIKIGKHLFYIDELNRIFNKLYKDGYINKDSDEYASFHSITFDGYVFVGYELSGLIILENENRRLRNDHRLIVGTWFAGIAALLLFLWQVFLYFYPVHADYPFFFWQK